jgi:hypothetical protein
MMTLDFSKAFENGRTVETEYGAVFLKTHLIGALNVVTGSIVACDPFVFDDYTPFSIRLPLGKYPVILSVACWDKGGDQRVAYAMLRISDEPAIRWESALLPNRDSSSLSGDDFFGYPVDSGTGCFMDSRTAKLLLAKDESYSEFMIAEMSKNYLDTWDWGNFELDVVSGANVITFKSGLGDGVYPSYFGFDSEGNVTGLVTDLLVIDDKEIYSEHDIQHKGEHIDY